MKKTFLILGAALTAIVPVVTVVSCGKETKSTKRVSQSMSDKSISEGLLIDGDKIGIDFNKANVDSPQFASDVLNFFNAHKGEQVVVALFNSPFTKINNHEATMRVSINGFSSLNQLIDHGLKALNDDYIYLGVEDLKSYQNLDEITTFRDVYSEKLAEENHHQAWVNYQTKLVAANAATVANPNGYKSSAPMPVMPKALTESDDTQTLTSGIKLLNDYIAASQAYKNGFIIPTPPSSGTVYYLQPQVVGEQDFKVQYNTAP